MNDGVEAPRRAFPAFLCVHAAAHADAKGQECSRRLGGRVHAPLPIPPRSLLAKFARTP